MAKYCRQNTCSNRNKCLKCGTIHTDNMPAYESSAYSVNSDNASPIPVSRHYPEEYYYSLALFTCGKFWPSFCHPRWLDMD